MPTLLLRTSAPAPYFHSIFLIFQNSPPLWRWLKFSPPPFKKRGPNYVGVYFPFSSLFIGERRVWKLFEDSPWMSRFVSYLYFSRAILHNKLKIWEMQAHQNESSSPKYFMLIHLWFYFVIFFFCGNLKFWLSVFCQTNLMK